MGATCSARYAKFYLQLHFEKSSSWRRINEVWEHDVCVCVWRMMEEHQPIGIDYQPIRDDDYIEDSMTQHYMEFDKDRGESRLWDHTFPQTEFAKDGIIHGSIN